MSDFVGTGTIALFYGHVASNVGDLAINRGEVAMLRRVFPNAAIRIVLLNSTRSTYLTRSKASFGPAGSIEFVHFSSDDKRAPSYVLDAGQFLDDCGATNADLVVLAAGEHLFHYAEHDNFKNLFWRTLPAFAAQQRGRRCLILPSTFGPFESTEAKAMMRALFATKPRVAVRDARSGTILQQSLALEPPEAALDPAFFLQAPDMAKLSVHSATEERRIGLVMRSERWGIRLSKANRDSMASDTESQGHNESLAFRFGVSLAKKTLSTGAHLRLFVQTAADQALSDAIAAECADEFDSPRIDVVVPRSIDEYLEDIAKVDAIVASRFHALVLALVAGRPCFGVYFDVHGHKIPGLFDLLERPDLCLALTHADVDAAAESAVRSIATPQTTLVGRLDALRQQTLQWLSADWSPANGKQQTLEDLRPLTPIAISLMHDASERSRAQSKKLGEVERELKALRPEVADLESRLLEEKEKSAEVERQLAESRATALETEEKRRTLEIALTEETSRLNDELRTARTMISARDRDMSVLLTAAKRERRQAIEAAEEAAKVRDTLVARVEMLEQSESFRLGYAIVRVGTAPRRLLQNIRRKAATPPATPESTAKAGKKAVRKEPADPVEPEKIVSVLTNDELARAHTAGGVDAIIAAIRDRAGQQPTLLSAALVQVSRQATDAGIEEIEYQLVQKAVELDRSDRTLRAMYWASQRAGNVREAWRYLTEIENLYGLNPNPSQMRWLEKGRSGPIMNLALLDEIVTAPAKAFVSEPNTICYVLHNSLPYSSGGYATRAHGMVQGLREVGIKATCITRPGYPFDVKPELDGKTLPTEDVVDDIPYRRLWEPKRGGSAVARYVRGSADALEAEFRKLRPSLVIAASAHLSALPALIAARRLGLPFVYEVRGFWEITRLSREPDFAKKPYFHVQKLLEAEISSRSDHVFTLTGPMREELADRGVPAEMISLLPNSCDPERFKPRHRDAGLAARLGIPNDVPVIGYIGTFVQYEGLEDLARACALLHARGLVFRLLLVGNEDTSNTGRGKITDEIQKIATESGFVDWLIMPGRVPHQEVEAYYSLIDIAPFPRKPQPVTEMVSPMKPLEALSMEKAVIVSSVRALTEMVSDGETGLVFEKGNIESMAETLALLIGDSELRARLGRTARAWVTRERTWTATAKKAQAEIVRIIDATAALGEVPDDQGSLAAAPVLSGSRAEAQRQHDTREEIFDAVRKMYVARDRARGKVRFSKDDWERTRLAFEIIEGAHSIVDIGIGQAQLVNLLARCEDVERVYGFDFRSYTTRIDPPSSGRYEFRVWDITRPLENPPEPVDVVVAMEVLEHIDVPIVPSVIERLRTLSLQGAFLASVPYREKEPLYHQGQRHGHKQSFDDAKIEELFGPGCLYSNYKQKWYVIFAHESLSRSERLDLTAFCERVQKMMHRVENEPASLQVSPAMG